MLTWVMPVVQLKSAPELEEELGYYKMKYYRLYYEGKVIGFIQNKELYFDLEEVKRIILADLSRKVKKSIPEISTRKIKLSWTPASLGKAQINLNIPTRASGRYLEFHFDTKSYGEQKFIFRVRELLKIRKRTKAYFPNGK